MPPTAASQARLKWRSANSLVCFPPLLLQARGGPTRLDHCQLCQQVTGSREARNTTSSRAHLDDVAVGVFGVRTHVDGKEGGDVVLGGQCQQCLVEIAPIPGAADIPATKLGRGKGGETPHDQQAQVQTVTETHFRRRLPRH